MTNKNKNISNSLFPYRISVPVDLGMSFFNAPVHQPLITDVLVWLFENVGPTINTRDRLDKESRFLKNIKIPHDKKYSKNPMFKYKINISRRRRTSGPIRVYFVNEYDKTHFAMKFGV